jgi:hypothetical protein
MTHYRITYADDRAAEMVEAERVTVEAGNQIVFHNTVLLMGLPREVIARRLSTADVQAVDEIADHASKAVDEIADHAANSNGFP